jgi:hypothetical protein
LCTFRSDNITATNQKPWKGGNPTLQKRENKIKKNAKKQFEQQQESYTCSETTTNKR